MSLFHVMAASLLLMLSALVQAEDHYIVSYVYDGDTVSLKSAQQKFKLRLNDIDAPERNQEYGLKARRALGSLCKGSNIRIRVELTGKDRYQRDLGKLYCNEIDASLYMAEHGHAWYNEKFSDNIAIKHAADQARQQRIGLWNADKPMPPWVWRRLHGNAYPANR